MYWVTEKKKKSKKSNTKFLSLNKVSCTLLTELRNRDTRALPHAQIFRLFWIPKKSLFELSHLKNYSPNFLPQKIQWSKFRTPKNPSIMPVTWNTEYMYPSWVYTQTPLHNYVLSGL